MLLLHLLLSLLALLTNTTASAAAAATVVQPGADLLVASQYAILRGRKVGLIANPTTILQGSLSHLVDVMHADAALVNLLAIFGPEHGFRGDQQAGSGQDTYVDNRTGITVYNTYDRSVSQIEDLLRASQIDTLVFDIQDVGTRFYTYVWTMWDCMRAATAVADISLFLVLDRPNPLGGELVDGPVLHPEYSSFIGRLPVTLVHGMTVGELARMFVSLYLPGTTLKVEVVGMTGWQRSMRFPDTQLAWVPPSPNMPTFDTAVVYPGLGLLEGTTLSTGRGTTRPFEIFGAPFFDWKYVSALQSLNLPGTVFRETYYIPTFDRFANNLTCGAQIYVTDPLAFDSLEVGLHIIASALRAYAQPQQFEFYSSDFDLHMGTNHTRLDLLAGATVDSILASWASDVQSFKALRQPFLLYT